MVVEERNNCEFQFKPVDTHIHTVGHMVTQSYNKHWTVYCIYKKNLNMTNIQTDTAHMLLLTSTMYILSTSLQLLHIHEGRTNTFYESTSPTGGKKIINTRKRFSVQKHGVFFSSLYIYIGPKCSFFPDCFRTAGLEIQCVGRYCEKVIFLSQTYLLFCIGWLFNFIICILHAKIP